MTEQTRPGFFRSNTKKALLTSILAMVLCVTMLLGTTMAWFTSAIEVKGNQIKAGKLAVALAKYDGTEYKALGSEQDGKIFDSDIWEPGRTEVALLEVKNAGNLALNYNVIFEVKMAGEVQADLSEVLEYVIIPGMDAEGMDDINNWKDFYVNNDGAIKGKLQSGRNDVYAEGALEKGNADYLALAVHMSEDAGNEYQGAALGIDVKVEAKQMAHEVDGFGNNQYDADALWTEWNIDVDEEVAKWKAMLAAEDALGHRYPEIPDSQEPLTENLITNGDFTNDLTDWEPYNKHQKWGIMSIVEGRPDGDGKAIRIQRNTAYNNEAMICHSLIEVTEDDWGDEYEVSYYFRKSHGERAATMNYYWSEGYEQGMKGDTTPYMVRNELGHSSDLMGNLGSADADGEWHYATGTFKVPKGAKYIEFALRAGNKNTTTADDYFDYDDITMVKIKDNGVDGAFNLDVDGKIFYKDMESTTATVTIAELEKNAAYANGYVKFELYGEEEDPIWTSDKVVYTNGVASTTMKLEYLANIAKPYWLKATMYDENDKKLSQNVEELYMFERPEYLSEDGKYIKYGEDFNPILGYHVISDADITKALVEGGVNVIQLGYKQSAEEVLEQLDNCAKLGVKGLVCLYYGMKPAAHESNLKGTIDIVSDPRVHNHEALFGYCTMDEPFVNLGRDEAGPLMVNSYRLIRQYDQKNLIFHMEANDEQFKNTSKYVDAMLIDRYDYPDVGDPIYNDVAKARAAVGNEKPVWSLLMAFHWWNGTDKFANRIITGDELRNNNWQALIAGSNMVGYYTISDAGHYPDPSTMPDGKTAMWEMQTADGKDVDLWEAVCEFNTKEKEIAYDHFLRDEGTELSKKVAIEDGYITYSWADKDGMVYVVMLNLATDNVDVSIDLLKADKTDMGDFTASVIAGRSTTEAGDILSYEGNKTLSVTISKGEAVFFEVTAK